MLKKRRCKSPPTPVPLPSPAQLLPSINSTIEKRLAEAPVGLEDDVDVAIERVDLFFFGHGQYSFLGYKRYCGYKMWCKTHK